MNLEISKKRREEKNHLVDERTKSRNLSKIATLAMLESAKKTKKPK